MLVFWNASVILLLFFSLLMFHLYSLFSFLSLSFPLYFHPNEIPSAPSYVFQIDKYDRMQDVAMQNILPIILLLENISKVSILWSEESNATCSPARGWVYLHNWNPWYSQAAAGQTLSLGRLSAVILVTAGRKIFFELWDNRWLSWMQIKSHCHIIQHCNASEFNHHTLSTIFVPQNIKCYVHLKSTKKSNKLV